MRKILPFIVIVSVMFSCLEPDIYPPVDIDEPEYQILKLSDSKSITCLYSYPSVDENGNPITLSSALVAWKPADDDSVETIKSVIVGCHITITSNKECPTSALGSFQSGDAVVMASLPTQADIPELRRSIMIMPDYQGYGISRDRIHPYLAQELTARQVTDALKYGLQLYKDLYNAQPFADDWKTICLGFSQGGAVALATHRFIEQHALDEIFHFAGSFCGDGPYDLIQTFNYYFEDDGQSYGVETQHKHGTTPEPLVLPLLVKGMIQAHPNLKGFSIGDFLTKQFIDTGIMDWIDSKEMTTDQIREKFYEIAENGHTASDGTYYSPQQMQELFPAHTKTKSLLGTYYHVTADLSHMFTPRILDYWNDGAASSREGILRDLLTALQDNSLIQGWEVKNRIVFLHSKYDTTVPLSNYNVFTVNHPEAQIRFIPYGKDDHEATGTKFFLSLTGTTFLEDFTWLFAEK